MKIYAFTGNKIEHNQSKNWQYELIDKYGNKTIMCKDEIKFGLRNRLIQITNMRLTQDGRLIQCKNRDVSRIYGSIAQLNYTTISKIFRHDEYNDEDRDVEFIVGQKSNELRTKALLLNKDIEDITKHIFTIRSANKLYVCTDYDIFVLSGNSYGLFRKIRCKSINFKNIDTVQLKYASEMFKAARIQRIDLTDFNTQAMINMDYMFELCVTSEIIIENKEFKNLKSMYNMFDECMASKIIIKNVKMPKLEAMDRMFENAVAMEIRLENVEINNNASIKQMFKYCKAKILTDNSKILVEVNKIKR